MPTTAKRNLGDRQWTFNLTGRTFDTDVTPSQAIRAAGLDVLIEKRPVYFDQDAEGGGPWVSGKSEIKGSKALVVKGGDGSETSYGVVSTGYNLIQNDQIGVTLDRLFPDNPVSVISNRGSAVGLFLALRLGDNYLNGDDVEEYLLITERRNAVQALRLSYFAGRLTCHNGMMSAISRWSVPIHHDSLLRAKVDDVLGGIARQRGRAQEDLESAARAEFNYSNKLSDTLGKIYRMPEQPALLKRFRLGDYTPSSDGTLASLEKDEKEWVRACSRVNLDRAGVLHTLTNSADEYKTLAFTGYHLVNAVAEWEQHLKPAKGDRSLGITTTWGERAEALDRAWSVVLD